MNQLTDPDPLNNDSRLQHASDTIAENYDSVIIIATRHEEGGIGGTLLDWAQSGNTFATKGAVREWVCQKDEDSRIYRRDNDKF